MGEELAAAMEHARLETTFRFRSRALALLWIAAMFNVPPWLIDAEGARLCLCEPDGACAVCDQA